MKKLILFTFTLTTIFAGELDFNHDGYPIKVDLKFYPFKWKVHKIYLPIDLLISKL